MAPNSAIVQGTLETWVLFQSSEDLTLKRQVLTGSGEEGMEGASERKKGSSKFWIGMREHRRRASVDRTEDGGIQGALGAQDGCRVSSDREGGGGAEEASEATQPFLIVCLPHLVYKL